MGATERCHAAFRNGLFEVRKSAANCRVRAEKILNAERHKLAHPLQRLPPAPRVEMTVLSLVLAMRLDHAPHFFDALVVKR